MLGTSEFPEALPRGGTAPEQQTQKTNSHLQVQELQGPLHRREHPNRPPADARREEALPLRHLQEMLYAAGEPAQTQTHPPRDYLDSKSAQF